jgi:hypothetical protein
MLYIVHEGKSVQKNQIRNLLRLQLEFISIIQLATCIKSSIVIAHCIDSAVIIPVHPQVS